MANNRRPSRPTSKKANSNRKVAYGRNLRPVSKRMVQHGKKGRLKPSWYQQVGRKLTKAKDIEAVQIVVSPRGREVSYAGQAVPGAKPPSHMPQTTQDYFLLSRSIRNMAYDYDKHILEIQFQTGHVYQYLGVPSTVWIAFQNAQSKGRFFHDRIYGEWVGSAGNKKYFPKYSYRRVR